MIAPAHYMNAGITKCLVIFLFLNLLAEPAVKSQTGCKIEHFSTEDGLSHDIITTIYKDREGFMWFGTWNGINRFDGHRFVTYKSSPGDQSYLRTHRVDQIVEDDYLHLWIQAYDRQIYRFDKRTEQLLPLAAILKSPPEEKSSYKTILAVNQGKLWIETMSDGLILVKSTKSDSSEYLTYRVSNPEAFRLPSNTINFFREDQRNRVWVGTSNGLVCLAPDGTGTYKKRNVGDFAKQSNVTSISFTQSGDSICVGTATGQVMVLDIITGKISILKSSGATIHTVCFNQLQTTLFATTSSGELYKWDLATATGQVFVYDRNIPLHSIYEDRQHNLWIEPDKQGVVKFDVVKNRFSTYTQKNNGGYNYSSTYYKVFEDNQGKVWVMLKGGGFGYYDPVSDQVAYFYNEPNASDHRFSNAVNLLFYDPTGILWLRTEERGLEKITFPRNKFSQHLLVSTSPFRSDNEVRGVFQDRKGKLWIGGKGGKLYVYRNGSSLQHIFINAPARGLGSVYTIMQDRDGTIWLGTKADGLYKAVPVNLEESQYKLYHYEHDPADSGSINSNEIYSLLQDDRGRIWVGTFDEGLNLIVENGTQVRFIHDDQKLVRYPKTLFRKIRHLEQDIHGNLWIGTTDGLLVMSTSRTGAVSYTTYQKIQGDHQSLGNNDIQFIFRDSRNNMWLATSGGGLNLAIGDNPLKALKFKVYTTKDGLPNDYLLSCREDREHNLWIATQSGLSKFDGKKKTFRNYNSYDGVPNFSFSEASGIRLQDGRLLFGTIRGFLTFDPLEIKDYPIEAGIAFTSLQVNNADVSPGGKDNILTNAIDNTSSLRLQYNQNIISIDYVVLDYRSSDKQFYAYRLAGFDTGWHYSRSERRATYTNLPPGNYVFEVKCVIDELYSNIPQKQLLISILPPPWKTWWAYILYILVAAAGLWLIRRIALTMLRLRQRVALEKKLAELKVNFFTNVSHELRTPMTLILNPIEEIARHENLSGRGRQYIEVVRKNAKRMGRFVNQLLDLRKLQSGKAKLAVSRVEIGSFIDNIGGYFAETAREKQINFRVQKNSGDIYVWLDAEKIETVIYNLLANAFKYTPAGKTIDVTITDLPGKDAVKIDISDQGGGVPVEKLNQIFELFYNDEQAAAKEIKGTGIGLALCRELTQLHEGTIAASNNQVGGLTLTVVLPLQSNQQYATATGLSSRNSTSFQLPAVELTTTEDRDNVETGGSEASGKPLILLVEDNTDLQFYLKSQLSHLYRVEVAANGQEGLTKARQLLPDLILSDVMMPVMDGIQMLGKLKTNTTTSHIPVILLTSKSAVESQVEALDYGADYYITKPFQGDFLSAAIRNLIERRKKILEALLAGKKGILPEPGEVPVTSQDDEFLQSILKVVEEKMTDVDFNIDAVAEQLAMGRTTFYRKFKSLTGLAPVEFVRDIRLKKAKQYLDAGYGNISEIAYLVGFNNPKYFSTCFKNRFTVTPTEYVKQKTDSSS